MTTRVTVGTNVSERASVPEFVYEYPFSEPARPGTVFVGPGRSAQAAPIFTLPPLKDYSSLSNTPNSVNGTMSSGHTWSDDASVGTVTRNPTVTPASTYSAIGTNLTSRPQSILEIRSAPTSANPNNQALHSFAPDEKVSGFHYATNLSTSRGAGGDGIPGYRRDFKLSTHFFRSECRSGLASGRGNNSRVKPGTEKG